MAAYHGGKAITVPDITDDERFPAFSPRALEAGLAAVFTFPLHHGERRLGAPDLYHHAPGPLSAPFMKTAQTLADVAAAYLLNAQARADLQDSSERSREAALHDALTALILPFDLSDAEVSITASIGIAFTGRDGDSPEQLLHDADGAMYGQRTVASGGGSSSTWASWCSTTSRSSTSGGGCWNERGRMHSAGNTTSSSRMTSPCRSTCRPISACRPASPTPSRACSRAPRPARNC